MNGTFGDVLDTGALIAADRGDRAVWARIEAMRRAGEVPVVPTPTIVEAWRDRRQARLARLLRWSAVVELDETTAREAGELLAVARRDAVDAVDAVVAVIAARYGRSVVTSDPRDIRALLRAAGSDADVLPV